MKLKLDIDKKMLRLELGEAPVFNGPCPAAQVLGGLGQMLDADNFFLVSYSALNLSFFLFLAAIGWARPPAVWIFAGLLLAITMLSADLCENRYLRQWIDHSGSVPLSAQLFTATAVKWGALAAASVLLGLIYLFNPRRKAKLVAVPAFAAAALLAAGLYQRCADWVNYGGGGLLVLWLLILIHSVIVAIEPPPLGAQLLAGKGEKNA